MVGNAWYKPEWREILRTMGLLCACYTFAFVCLFYSFGWDIVGAALLTTLAMLYTLFGSICLMARKTSKKE